MPWQKQFDTEEILDRAMQAFWSCGYEATSMQDLVDCTGINRGSLYGTYGDKRALFISALHRYDDTVRRRMLAELESHSPRDAIRAVFMAFVESVSEQAPNRGCFMTNTALELAAHDPEIREIVRGAQEDMRLFFQRMIERGKELQEIPPELPAKETARGLLASFLGLIVLTRSCPEQPLLRGIVDDVERRLG